MASDGPVADVENANSVRVLSHRLRSIDEWRRATRIAHSGQVCQERVSGLLTAFWSNPNRSLSRIDILLLAFLDAAFPVASSDRVCDAPVGRCIAHAHPQQGFVS